VRVTIDDHDITDLEGPILPRPVLDGPNVRRVAEHRIVANVGQKVGPL
jgi:hypothetical protein